MATQAELMTKAGFHFEGKKLLAAYPVGVEKLYMHDYLFRAELDGKGNVKKPHYTPVKKKDYAKLKSIKDPSTGEPYLKFVMAKAPDTLFVQEEELKVESLSSSDVEEIESEIDFGGGKPAPAKKEEVKDDDAFNAQFDAASQGEDVESSDKESSESEDEGEESKTLTPAELERVEIEKMSVKELKKHLKDDLGIEVPAGASKKELIELALG